MTFKKTRMKRGDESFRPSLTLEGMLCDLVMFKERPDAI